MKGDVYEGLLEKNAQDAKSGAGQYFTPRALIKAIVDVMQPAPGETICDPACGTGGFLLAAHDYVAEAPQARQGPEEAPAGSTRSAGWELVDSTARLCAMNLFLHGIGADDETDPIAVDDASRSDPGDRFEHGADQSAVRQEVEHHHRQRGGRDREGDAHLSSATTSGPRTKNKQLNFVQHVKTLLKINGRAAVVVPDNVLFEGGAGETVRRKLLQECDVHTLLRLPTGIFYAQGVKANVLFFDRKPGAAEAVDEEALDLRPADQHALHAQDEPAQARGPRRVRRVSTSPANRHERKATWSEKKPEGRWRAFASTSWSRGTR